MLELAHVDELGSLEGRQYRRGFPLGTWLSVGTAGKTDWWGGPGHTTIPVRTT